MLSSNLRRTTSIGIALAVVLLTLGTATVLSRSETPSFSSSPLPTPPPALTPTPGLPDSQRAVLYIAQREGIAQEWLKAVDSSTIEFRLTERRLWRGLVLDTKSRLHYLYEVFIDQDTGEILDEIPVDPRIYWLEEENAFREKHGERILDLVADRKGVSADQFEIADGVLGQDPLSGQMVWEGTIIDASGVYYLAVGEQGQEIALPELEEHRTQARYAKYGKTEPRLFYLMATQQPADVIEVLLWIGGVDHASVDNELARRYPQVGADYFASGQPFTGRGTPVVIEPELEETIRDDYNDLLDQAHHRAAEPVMAFLKEKGYEAEVLDAFPGIVAKLPVSVIQELNQAELGNLSTIYLAAVEIVPQMDSVGGTIRVSSVWGQGYTGSGVRLGVMDTGIVDPNTTHSAFAGKWIIVPQWDETSLHAAQVAGVMFGNDAAHPEYRGVAYGSAELVSVGIDNDATWQSINDGLNNLVDEDAFVIDISLNLYGYRDMHPSDRVVDYVVRYRDPTIVTIAGNNGNQEPHQWYVNSPGKAYNAITVGGFEDINNVTWRDDVIWSDSCYRDPYIDGSFEYTHKKPDVAGVSTQVQVIQNTIGDQYVSTVGTSVAAPQVAGLAALLVDRYYWLRVNPEAVTAITMASAINDTEGSIPYSEKDGAGGIVASEAMAVFDRGGWAHHIIHNINDPNDPSNPFNGFGTSYYFQGSGTDIWDYGTTYAEGGERVRAVICWDSNPSSSFGGQQTDLLATALFLRVYDPYGSPVDGAYSGYSDNNCQVVDFVAPETGEYRMQVTYYSHYPDGLDLGLASLGCGFCPNRRICTCPM